MKFKISKLKIGAMVVAILALTSADIFAQDKLPTADEVIAKYVEATGGLDKYKSLKSIKQTGEMSIPMMGINGGSIQIQVGGENKLRVDVDIPGVGKEASGCDGETCWSESLATGTRVLTGKERDQALLETNFRRMYDPASVHKKLEMIGKEDVDGEACYHLKVTKQNDDVQHEYYSIESGLQLMSKTKVTSPMGEMAIEASVDGYQDVDGLMFPKKMIQKFDNGMKIEVEFDEIVLNPEFEDGTFDLPESVQKIVEKKKAKEAKKAAEGKDK